jgi:hypothetical protein
LLGLDRRLPFGRLPGRELGKGCGASARPWLNWGQAANVSRSLLRRRRKQRHIDAHHIAEALVKYPRLPSTFDGSIPSESLDDKPRAMIGETYLFEGTKNLSGTDGDLVATVTSATVLENVARDRSRPQTKDRGQPLTLTSPTRTHLFPARSISPPASRVCDRAVDDTALTGCKSHADNLKSTRAWCGGSETVRPVTHAD